MKQLQEQLGLAPEVVCAEAKLGIVTLYKVYSDHPRVTEKSRVKVRNALGRLRAQTPEVKAVG